MEINETLVLKSLGAVRLGIGGALVVAPTVAGRIWIGDDAGGPGTRVFARALGARDVVLGTALLRALGDGDLRRAAVHARTGVWADVADVAATIMAVRSLSGSRRWSMPLIAAVVGGAGLIVRQAADEA